MIVPYIDSELPPAGGPGPGDWPGPGPSAGLAPAGDTGSRGPASESLTRDVTVTMRHSRARAGPGRLLRPFRPGFNQYIVTSRTLAGAR